MEKARSLIEAEANLDEMDDGFHESYRDDGVSQNRSPADATERGAGHPSGFAPASASQSGFSPAAAGRAEPSGMHPRPVSAGESGVFSGVPGPVSGERLVDSLQSALGAASRNEAGLGSLQRAIRDASRAFTASRHAQEALTEDLRVMYRGLNELMSEKAAVERYAALLTQERDAALDAAEEARLEAKRERDFLLREQDRFIQLLLEEHEAELQQLRRSQGQRQPVAAAAEVAPQTHRGLVAARGEVAVANEPGADERVSAPPPPPGEELASPPLTGAALARQALANTVVNDRFRAVPMPGGESTESSAADVSLPTDTRRSEDDGIDERAPTYPPAPAVLDLEALAAEVDGNSERPPPIRRIGAPEPKIHLKPARVPTQLFDTLVSPVEEHEPSRKR